MSKRPSFARLPKGVARDKRLTESAKDVLCILAGYIDKNGKCFPRQKAIASEAGISRKSVQVALRLLQVTGWIEITCNQRDGSANVYKINPEPSAQIHLFEERPAKARKASRGVPPKGGRGATLNGGGGATSRGGRGATSEGGTINKPNNSPELRCAERAREDTQPNGPNGSGSESVDLDLLEARLREAAGPSLHTPSPSLLDLSEPLRWLEGGCDFERDVLPTIRAKAAASKPNRIRSWAYFTEAVIEARDRRQMPIPPPNGELHVAEGVTIIPPGSQSHGSHHHHNHSDPFADAFADIAAARKAHQGER